MVDIRPFRGYSYNPAKAPDLTSVVAPPYDVVTEQERDELASRSPFNFIHMTLPAHYNDGQSNTGFYDDAAARWNKWKTDGIVEQVSTPAIWCLKETYETQNGKPVTRTGFLAELSLEKDSDRFVLRHERTHTAPRMDRVKLYEATRANLSPLFFIYQDQPDETAEFMNQFEGNDSQKGVLSHRGDVSLEIFRSTDESSIDRFCRSLRDTFVLIADGHHRYEASRIVHSENPDSEIDTSAILAYLVPTSSPGLMVKATHRAIHGLCDYDEHAFLQRLDAHFDFDASESESNGIEVITPTKGLFRITPTGETVRKLRNEMTPSPLADVNVVILEEIILKEILGFSEGDISAKKNLTYFQEKSDGTNAVASGRWNAAFFLSPIPIDDLFTLTRGGAILPQKSTYFYPKVATGLLMRSMEKS